MASYTELFDLIQDSDLRNKVAVAVGVAADTIRVEDAGTANHANRVIWAKGAFSDPMAEAEKMLWAVVSANSGQTIANIQGASDVSIQTNVDAVVDIFADGS